MKTDREEQKRTFQEHARICDQCWKAYLDDAFYTDDSVLCETGKGLNNAWVEATLAEAPELPERIVNIENTLIQLEQDDGGWHLLNKEEQEAVDRVASAICERVLQQLNPMPYSWKDVPQVTKSMYRLQALVGLKAYGISFESN